jgi:hypothetical protein
MTPTWRRPFMLYAVHRAVDTYCNLSKIGAAAHLRRTQAAATRSASQLAGCR